MTKKKLSRGIRAGLMEELKSVHPVIHTEVINIDDSSGAIPVPARGHIHEAPQRAEIVGLPHRKHRLELAKLLDILRPIFEGKSEEPLKFNHILKAVELAAKLDGHLETHKEEKHVHLHGNDLAALSEQQLRLELERIDKERSSIDSSGVPHPVEGTV